MIVKLFFFGAKAVDTIICPVPMAEAVGRRRSPPSHAGKCPRFFCPVASAGVAAASPPSHAGDAREGVPAAHHAKAGRFRHTGRRRHTMIRVHSWFFDFSILFHDHSVIEHAERLVVLCHDLEFSCHDDGLTALRIGGVRIRQLEGNHFRAASRAV